MQVPELPKSFVEIADLRVTRQQELLAPDAAANGW
jgi:hypothetical protein